jgi:hypothetical protein
MPREELHPEPTLPARVSHLTTKFQADSSGLRLNQVPFFKEITDCIISRRQLFSPNIGQFPGIILVRNEAGNISPGTSTSYCWFLCRRLRPLMDFGQLPAFIPEVKLTFTVIRYIVFLIKERKVWRFNGLKSGHFAPIFFG